MTVNAGTHRSAVDGDPAEALDTRMQPRPGHVIWPAGFAVVYELSRGLHREASWRAERFGPIRISTIAVGTSPSGTVGRARCGKLRAAFGVGGKKLAGKQPARLDRRVFVRNPNCRMRTKPRGRMCCVKRRRNSVDCQGHLALLVAMRVVFPAEGDALSVECQ